MAHPAGFIAQDNRMDMGIPVFWTSASSDPPWNFKIWLDQFMLAVTVKESVNPEILLEEPKEVIDEPMPALKPQEKKKLLRQLLIGRRERD